MDKTPLGKDPGLNNAKSKADRQLPLVRTEETNPSADWQKARPGACGMTSSWTSRPTTNQVYSVILNTGMNSGVQNYTNYVKQQNLYIQSPESHRSEGVFLTVNKLLPNAHTLPSTVLYRHTHSMRLIIRFPLLKIPGHLGTPRLTLYSLTIKYDTTFSQSLKKIFQSSAKTTRSDPKHDNNRTP